MEGRDVKRGEVYYVDLAGNVGYEQGGVRPAVVIQNDIGNKHSGTVIVVPLTSNIGKRPQPTHAFINLQRTSVALAEQPRTVDKSRLGKFVCTISGGEMMQIENALIVSLGLGIRVA